HKVHPFAGCVKSCSTLRNLARAASPCYGGTCRRLEATCPRLDGFHPSRAAEVRGMILNAYAVLDSFTTALRLALGLFVLGLALWHGRRRSAKHTVEGRQRLEDRGYLLFLAAGVLLALNVLSWPLLYLLLQSYVPEWPGVMCIYGVTRVGEGSLGPARHLPDLLRVVQWMKPVLVFVGGAWFVLYLMNRRTATAPLVGRLL